MMQQKKLWRNFMDKLDLSVALIVYNEEERLYKTLERAGGQYRKMILRFSSLLLQTKASEVLVIPSLVVFYAHQKELASRQKDIYHVIYWIAQEV